jgi:hypothetical protein
LNWCDRTSDARLALLGCATLDRAAALPAKFIGRVYATVKLITSVVGAITRGTKLGRAEVLRRTMLALIDKGEPHEAHPAYWAPFIVVGEGAAR